MTTRRISTKRIFIILSIIGLALFVSKLYFHSGFPYTHDGENHLARFANYKVALKEGQVPPRFAPNLMNHYGYPVFNYNYPLANIISVPFSLIKLNYQFAYKSIAIGAISFGLIGLWRWLLSLNISSTIAIVGSMAAAVSSPYLLSLLYFRGNIGELLAWSFVPWLFASAHLPNKKSVWLTCLVATLWTLFFLSHNVSVLIVTPIILSYTFFVSSDWKAFFSNLFVFFIGIAGSLWFWLPALTEKSAIILDGASLSNNFANHFPTIYQLVWSPQTFGFSQTGSIDGLSFNLGLASIVALLICLIGLLKSTLPSRVKQFKNPLLVIAIFSLTLAVIQISFFTPLWNAVPLVHYIQFPWRLTLVFSILTSILAGQVFQTQSKQIRFLMFAILVVQLIAAWHTKPVDYFNKNTIDYDLFAQSTTTAKENLPKDFTYIDFADNWAPRPTSTSNVSFSVESWTGTNRTYQVDAPDQATIIEPTMFFPGWQTTITNLSTNNKEYAKYQNSEQIAGRLAYVVEPGVYQVSTSFTQNTTPRLIGNSISLIVYFGLILCFGISIYHKYENEQHK